MGIDKVGQYQLHNPLVSGIHPPEASELAIAGKFFKQQKK